MAESVLDHRPKAGLYRKYLKRRLDVALSLCATVGLSPVLLVVAASVRITMGSPVIFRQERVGLHEKVFTLYKFRTMTDDEDEDGCLLPDEARLTRLGRMLRCTSLDELPQLWNVLKGDMSIVGPRPLGAVYLPYYNESERHRHDVRPGLSSSAAVHGRTTPAWEVQFACDTEYVDDISLLGDLRIVGRTVVKILRWEGTSDRGDFHTHRAGRRESETSQPQMVKEERTPRSE